MALRKQLFLFRGLHRRLYSLRRKLLAVAVERDFGQLSTERICWSGYAIVLHVCWCRHELVLGIVWARPVFSGDNPLSTGFVSSCPYLNDATNFIIIQANYVIFDNFEFIGNCSGSNPNAAFITPFNTPLEISNSYFHGWTVTSFGKRRRVFRNWLCRFRTIFAFRSQRHGRIGLEWRKRGLYRYRKRA